MNRQEFHIKAHQILLVLLAFSLPFPLLFSNILIFLILPNHLAEAKISFHLKNTFNNEINWYLLILYFLFVLSAFISLNTNDIGSILERKLVLLAFPVLLYKTLDLSVFKRILMAFVTGVSIALFYCVLASVYQYFLSGDINHLFYHALAGRVKLNAIYLSAYIVFSLFILIYFYRNSYFKNPKLYIVLALFLFLGLILLSSKMMFFIFILGLFYLVLSDTKSNFKQSLSFLIPVILIIVLAISIPQIKNRFLLEITSNLDIVKLDKYTYNTPFTGTTLRLTIWKHCYQIIKRENSWLMGVGLGDFQNLLNNEYVQTGMYVGNPNLKDTGYLGYGPHNQYIEMLFSIGIIGFFVFLLLIVRLLNKAKQSLNYLFVLFVILNLFFFMTESALSTNKGIVFFTFFTMVFITFKNTLKTERIAL